MTLTPRVRSGPCPRLHSGQSMAYSERQKSANKQLSKDAKSNRHNLFKKRDEAAKRKAKERAAGGGGGGGF